MCKYIDFLNNVLIGNHNLYSSEHINELKRDHNTFELCLKILSTLLGVKSLELPLDQKNSILIWDYFNGRLSHEVIGILNNFEGKNVEVLLLEVTKLLILNISVGLQPILAKLPFDISPKEFYSRSVILILNLATEAHKKYGYSFGSADNLTLDKNDLGNFEDVEKWKNELFECNLAFALCRLALALSIFGTEEAGLFDSFKQMFSSLLALFPRELWMYLLGSFPLMCFDHTFLFSLKSLGAYVTVMSEQCCELIQNLIACRSFNIYAYDQVEDLNKDLEHTCHILTMSNWIDYLYKYVQNKVLMCNSASRSRCVIITTWLSKLLNSKVVLTIIYSVFKYNYHICINTLIKLACVSDNVVFLHNVMFKTDSNDAIILELLSRLDLGVISKDALSITAILSYLIEGFKSKQMVEFYPIWKLYLKQYDKVVLNKPLVDSMLETMLEYLVSSCYKQLKFPSDVFRTDVRRADVKERRFTDDRMASMIKRNVFLKLVDILGFQTYRDIFIESIELGYNLAKKLSFDALSLVKIEFSMFLIYSLKLEHLYGDIYEFGVNNGYALFYRHLMKINEAIDYSQQYRRQYLDLEEEYFSYLTYYYTNRIMEHNNKEAIPLLNTLITARDAGKGLALYFNNKIASYLLDSLIINHVEILLQNVVDLMHDSESKNLNTLKLYLKCSSLYYRVYDSLNCTDARERISTINFNIDSILTRFLKLYDKVLIKSMGILVRNPDLSEMYHEVLNVPFKYSHLRFLEILGLSYDLTINYMVMLMDNFEYLGDKFVKPIVDLVVNLTERLTSKQDWNVKHVETFEKLQILVREVINTNTYLDELMEDPRGPSSLKKILVVANSVPIEETNFRLATAKLNISIMDILLNLSEGPLKRKRDESTLRNQDYELKRLEEILKSPCAKFEIFEGEKEHKIALGTLGVLDLLIYRSFEEVFGGERNENKPNKNKSNDIADVDLETKPIRGENTAISDTVRSLKWNNKSKIWDLNDFSWRNQDKLLFADHLFYWNLMRPECMLALEFIAKMYIGFHLLPRSKFMLISEYFYFYASSKSNMETKEIKKRFLEENNKVRLESPMFIYEFYKIIEKKSFI